MLNMFKSNNKQTVEIITNESSLMVKQFENLNINIYGTYENPLFKAKDIGELLEMSNIREVIKNFNNKQRCDVSLTDAIGREQKTTFLTEQGLYKVLMKSRKSIAELYLDTDNVHAKLSNKIRLEIEKWIRSRYKNLNYQYKDSCLHGERYRGWIGLKLK